MSVEEICNEFDMHCKKPAMEIEINNDDDEDITSQMDLDGMLQIASASIDDFLGKDYALPEDASSEMLSSRT